MLVGLASLTTTMQRTSGKGVDHQAPTPVLVMERDPVAPVLKSHTNQTNKLSQLTTLKSLITSLR